MKYNESLKISLLFVALLWGILILDFIIPLDFVQLGIYPRSFLGIPGIILAPFLHSGVSHLTSNSIPLLVLMTIMLSFYTKIAFVAMFFMVVYSDILVWLLARPAYHVGASGLIYALVAFLITAGFLKKSPISIFIAVVVGILYGGLAWGMLPGFVNWYVSWESHLFGAITGTYLAYFYKKQM